ncbi:sodium/solute symporter [Allokutzneria albata]|uniref:Sodium:solute symporter family protein n=1 Tax=Allokutzneria albata TaxID=211114 RepID=A0A1H0A4D5_ALLAB|nr:cation acetate symporter [Allokutzneria albata]SDN28287.1 Sodium:solute symporter family protein [Allokutzneria albata]
MVQNNWALGGVILAMALTIGVGVYAGRRSKTTPDFLVASRTIRPHANAAAIAGEYLSAASFLGVAGLVFTKGATGLWYPFGYAGGYLALLLFVAAPLRRSGAYTVPDFAEARLGSVGVRRLCTAVVVLLGWWYLVPQFQGAGLTLSTFTGVPPWLGGLAVAATVTINVIGGGMRAITLVQAFQYYLKLFALAFPAFLLFFVFLNDDKAEYRSLSEPLPPAFARETTIDVTTPVRLQVPQTVSLRAKGVIDGAPVDGGAIWAAGTVKSVGKDTKLVFPAGAPVPSVTTAAADNASWLRPMSGGWPQVLEIWSLMFATFFGTMGLPHVLVRFYTNPDGSSARTTTLYVLVLVGGFYLFSLIFAGLSRLYVPELLVTGQDNTAVLLLPSAMLDNWFGQLLAALTAAGAFAAFLSTSSGLVVSVAGVLSTDVLPGRVRDFRLATVFASTVPIVCALLFPNLGAAQAVGLALCLAASTFCPLLILGIWYRGLTPFGATMGILTGGGVVLGSTAYVLLTTSTSGWVNSLVAQPGMISVPLSFLSMWFFSKLTPRSVPRDVSQVMLRMHAPDRLGFTKDRDVQRFGNQSQPPVDVSKRTTTTLTGWANRRQRK